ncbi:MAG: hypothetical protein R2699_09225 [Acidimicrobiales bacterium]
MADDKATSAAAEERQRRDDELLAAHRKGDARAFGRIADAWMDDVYDRVLVTGVPSSEAGERTAAILADVHGAIASGDGAARSSWARLRTAAP